MKHQTLQPAYCRGCGRQAFSRTEPCLLCKTMDEDVADGAPCLLDEWDEEPPWWKPLVWWGVVLTGFAFWLLMFELMRWLF